ncbi:YeiH family protein [Eupransor demetentiae]|uniref:UPF0324 family (YeiH) n=1 Tax=Eupransor demetentiae TaxID=3109584 RepID=A0ABM9N3Z9_9LACO|nr:UPF0324 family (YeiH) [Lactobacillaceae bacterium LMG 33000]
MRIKSKDWLGLILTLIWSIIAMGLAKFLPQFGAESIAMLGGIVLGNTFFNADKYASGVKWAEKYPIEIGIALLGATLTFSTIGKLGWQGIVFIILNMALIILVVDLIGKYIFKVDLKSRMLMSAGNAVCGSSAIAGVTPAIGANDNQRRTAVATVSLTGMLLLFTLPELSHFLFGSNNFLAGALIGGTVQSVGQVVGTAALMNQSVVTYATLFKLLRVIMLAAVVVFFAYRARRQGGEEVLQQSKKSLLPWYIIAFVFLLVINSFWSFPKFINTSCHELTAFFGVVNLAGIGLNLKWETIKKSGVKFLLYGALTGICQVILAVCLIHIFF